MAAKQIWLDWLGSIKTQGKDPSDPTYLMQAFSLTRKQAEAVISEWEATPTPDTIPTPSGKAADPFLFHDEEWRAEVEARAADEADDREAQSYPHTQ